MNETLNAPREFKAPVANFASLQAKIEKLNRRAVKLGVAPVVLTVLREEVLEVLDEDASYGSAVGDIFRKIPLKIFTVAGETPKLPGGWKFAATIQHTTEGNIIRAAGPDAPATPACFRDVPARCEHCQLTRNRVDTYLLVNDEGSFKQVGRTCLADFLGSGDPETWAAIAEFFTKALEICGECDDDFLREYCGSSGDKAFSLDGFLGYVAAAVRLDGGFWSKAAVDKLFTPRQTTKDLALEVLFPPEGLPFDKRCKLEARRPLDEDNKFASEALTWAREHFTAIPLADRSDFDHNMAVVSSQEYITFRETGLAAYLVEAYRRELGFRAERKAGAASQHVGEVGKRLRGLALTVVSTHPFDNAFGGGCFIKFVDADGNRFTWKASSTVAWPDVGEAHAVTGTVKDHSEWKGIKETYLTRCKLESKVAA